MTADELLHVPDDGMRRELVAGLVLATDPDTVRAPDAAFVRRERVDALGDTPRFWPEAPALAVEVISPSDSPRDVEEKVPAIPDADLIAVGSALLG